MHACARRRLLNEEEVMSWDRFEGNWNQTKDKVRGKWRKLTSDDLDAIHGRRDLLESTIEQRYGFAPDYVHKEVDDWFRWQNWRSSHFTTSILTIDPLKTPTKKIGVRPYRLKA
jgi:uncharacterized protein YjbJ (UPF0337 family)